VGEVYMRQVGEVGARTEGALHGLQLLQ
jgi:hypothetical protein